MNAIDPNVTEMPPSRVVAQQASRRWVSFELAGQRYAVAISKVFEVLSSVDIEPVPTAPTGVLGVINLRGSIVTVMDLRHWMAFAPLHSIGCVLIANHDGQPVGFCVDRIIEVLNLPDDVITAVPPSSASEFPLCVTGMVNRSGEILTLLDLSRLLPLDAESQTRH